MAAGSIAILVFYVISSSLTFLCGVHGRSLFTQQDIISTKTDQKGQIYDCVDFFKQPAFTHPLLKNLTSKAVRPKLTLNEHSTLNLGLIEGGCPSGTVPIQRVGANDREPPAPTAPKPQEHCVAIVHTVSNDKKFLGSRASLNIYKPVVGDTQWSAARIKLINGQDSIEAGWMVNPSLFNDHEAHLYGRFTAGGSGCFNTVCPGFVQVSRDVALGGTPDHYSVIGGVQQSWNITIDKTENAWWISIGANENPIGYWPGELFTSLKEGYATQVEWGGEISNPGPTTPIPDMGNGLKATYDLEYSTSFVQVTVVDENSNFVIPSDTKKVWDCEDLYTVKDGGDRFQPQYGRVMFYGGGYHERS